MPKKVDMIGKRYGRLVAVKETGKGHNGYRYLFACDCGNQKDISGAVVRSGKALSCGCYKSEYVAAKNFVHGMVHAGSYNSWQAMKTRCNNPNQDAYKRYGGVGITYDPRWEDFKNFVEDMGERPFGMTLDRINPFGNYEKSNCRWADAKTQATNKQSNYLKEHGLCSVLTDNQ